MSIWVWILLGLPLLLGLLVVIGLLTGVGTVFVAFFTGIYHLFIKPDPVPGENDANWSRDQAKEIE